MQVLAVKTKIFQWVQCPMWLRLLMREQKWLKQEVKHSLLIRTRALWQKVERLTGLSV